jgi:hypothetical protein
MPAPFSPPNHPRSANRASSESQASWLQRRSRRSDEGLALGCRAFSFLAVPSRGRTPFCPYPDPRES